MNRQTLSETLLQAKDWLGQDPDPETSTELSELIDKAEQQDPVAIETLQSRFSGRLQFGTAGLRGRLQAGSMGMNRVLVGQTAAGLARYLTGKNISASVVIGYDGRKNSKIFAYDSAEIMAAAGVKVSILPRCLPTPVLAFAVRALDAAAGIMVTASHNPPQDNGYKVYLGGEDGGAQIIPPADSEIAAQIDHIAKHERVDRLPRSDAYQVLDEHIVKQYIAKTASLSTHPIEQNLRYVYTAMHGVGYETFAQTLAKAGLPSPIVVEAQRDPDPTFATVNFPNPEEPGALDLAIKTAKANNAEFIIANDPDADRFAVAVADENGHWHSLHGNTIGALLGWYLAEQYQDNRQKNILACSLVSSQALKAIAQHYGLTFVETLTGFKWIGRIPNLIFGYEEALGYLVDSDKVHDKDGISAAIVFLDLIMALRQKGQTFNDYRRQFEQTFGAYASGQVAIRFEKPEDIFNLMQALRNDPPTSFGKAQVTEFVDHLQTDKQSNILVFYLNDQSRLIIRPSGTEPKVKFYIDVKMQDSERAQAKVQALAQVLKQLISEYRQD